VKLDGVTITFVVVADIWNSNKNFALLSFEQSGLHGMICVSIILCGLVCR
jgi:hypothetical protein